MDRTDYEPCAASSSVSLSPVRGTGFLRKSSHSLTLPVRCRIFRHRCVSIPIRIWRCFDHSTLPEIPFVPEIRRSLYSSLFISVPWSYNALNI